MSHDGCFFPYEVIAREDSDGKSLVGTAYNRSMLSLAGVNEPVAVVAFGVNVSEEDVVDFVTTVQVAMKVSPRKLGRITSTVLCPGCGTAVAIAAKHDLTGRQAQSIAHLIQYQQRVCKRCIAGEDLESALKAEMEHEEHHC